MEQDNLTMYEIVHKNALEHPRNIAIYYQKTKITYKKFDKLINNMANILANKLSVHQGDVITISLPNIPNALVLLYAANKIGAICNMVHPFTPYNQLRVLMRKTKSKWAFVFEQRVAKELDRFKEIADYCYVCRVEDFLPQPSKVLYHTFMNFRIRKKLKRGWKFQGFKYYYRLKDVYKDSPFVKGKGNDCCLLLHSGSTTGEPKTICLSHLNMNFIASKGPEEMCCKESDLEGKAMISFLPSFHGFGLGMTMHTPLYHNMTTVLIPKFSPHAIVEAMKHIKCHSICGVPTAFEALVNSEEFQQCAETKYLMSSWSGGDALPYTVQEKWRNILKSHGSNGELYEGYGLTESVAAVVVNTNKHHKDKCLGYPLEGVEVGIFKENGKRAKVMEVGEIAIKSPSNMISYFADPSATDHAVRNGFVFTGDLGYVDEEGYVFFSSRKKRVVKVSGVGVFPSEIEHLVETVPGVKKVAAIRIPDPKLQSAIKLILVSDVVDKVGLEHDILETCRRYLIRWAVPKEFEYRDDLPLTLYNKTNVRLLQEEEDKKRGIVSENKAK